MKILQILILIFAFTVGVIAQKAVLSGNVYDANGSLIVGAKVSAINEKGEKFETFTNDDGIYTLKLPYNPYRPGSVDFKIVNYEIIVEKENFDESVLKNFKFVPSYGGKMFLDFALDVHTYKDPIIVDSNKINNKIKRKNNK